MPRAGSARPLATRLPHHWANQKGSALCISDDHRGSNWTELDDRSARLAGGLVAASGVESGDRVAVLTSNRIEWFETSLALARIGATMVPLHRRLKPVEAERLVEHSDCTAIVVDNEAILAAAVTWAESRIHCLQSVVTLSQSAASGLLRYEQLIGESVRHTGKPAASPRVVSYTSGTTGEPKAIIRQTAPERVLAVGKMLSHLFARLRFSADERHLLCCPVSHAAPPFYAQFALALGGLVVMVDRFEPETLLQVIESHAITSTFMVPTMLSRVTALPEDIRNRYDTSSLRSLISGAAPLPIAVRDQTVAMFGDDCLFDIYGTTETGNVSLLEPHQRRRKPGCVGRALTGVKARVVDDEGVPLQQDEVGEIAVDSPLVSRWGEDGAHEATTRTADGYFRTGDLGHIDVDGYVHIVGRVKDVIIRGGEKIYPAEVENVLRGHPSVLDVAVVALPHPDLGEMVGAFIELREGYAAPEPSALRGLCEEQLARFKRPSRIELVKELPRSAVGKVLKRQLVQQLPAERS